MERHNGRLNPLLFLLALPSVLFVVVHALKASGILRVPYGRIDAVFGGQPGASVVLVSALTAFAIAMNRVAAPQHRFFVRLRVSEHRALVLPLALLAVWLFGRFYIREYAWLYTRGGSGFFEAAVALMTVALVLKLLPSKRPTAG